MATSDVINSNIGMVSDGLGVVSKVINWVTGLLTTELTILIVIIFLIWLLYLWGEKQKSKHRGYRRLP